MISTLSLAGKLLVVDAKLLALPKLLVAGVTTGMATSVVSDPATGMASVTATGMATAAPVPLAKG